MNINYTITGTTGPKLVFIHGFLGSNRQWQAVHEQLERNYQIMSVELPGHGDSPASENAYALEQVSAELHEILLRENFSKPTLIGHSMGGYVASCYYSLYPDNVRRAILINSISGTDSQARSLMRDRSIELIKKYQNAFVNMAISNLFTHQEREESVKEIETMKAEAHDITQDSVIHAILAMKNRRGFVNQLSENGADIHYIYSARDSIVPAEVVEKETVLLNATCTVIDSGHMSILTHPGLIAELLENQFILP